MDYTAAVAYLDAHIGRGMKPGLDRIQRLLEMMGHPEDGYPLIHIAGTNGKTSTARLATAILAAHGLNVGAFTSPHLEVIEERIGVNGRHATPDELAQAVTDVAAFADIFEARSTDHLTYFELTAAMGFAWFADMAVDAAVVEVGLGGRLDATNAARGDVAVVTGIDFDHTETLGNTLAAIAGEKLGIVKPGSILVTGQLPDEALEVARKVAAEVGVEHFEFGRDYRIEGASTAFGGWSCGIAGIRGDYDDLYLPLHGRHQVRNLAVAIASCECLLGDALDGAGLREGIGAVTSPGRLEQVALAPVVVLDGAHNPEGFRSLGHSLREEYADVRWVLVMAAMIDKDLAGMLPSLAGRISSAVTTEVGSPRSLPSAALAELVEGTLGVEAYPEADPGRALDKARTLAGPAGAVLVTGSLYLVGAIRSLIRRGEQAQRNER